LSTAARPQACPPASVWITESNQDRERRRLRRRDSRGSRPQRGLTCRRPRVAPHPDLVERRFIAPAPDRLWVADVSYIPTAEGWLYLATILDCFSRSIVGWSMAHHLRTELVVDALCFVDAGTKVREKGRTQRPR
jgi:putative transposase